MIARRAFLQTAATTVATSALAPLAGCGAATTTNRAAATSSAAASSPGALPLERPADWDALAFNLARADAGAVPASYLPNLHAEGGETAHLGKHLPYVAALEGAPTGVLPLMLGDASAGRPRHPASAGHYVDWIRLRKAAAEAEETETRFTGWPTTEGPGALAAFDGGALDGDEGRNTVYLAQLPSDVSPGDVVRVVVHCNVHGEYVEFVTVPA